MGQPGAADAREQGHHWRARAAALPLDTRPFIDGSRIDALADSRFALTSACDGGPLAEAPDCNGHDVDRAVAAARRALDDGRWADRSAASRADTLRAFAALIERDAETLALLDSVQMGMPVAISVPGMASAAGIVRQYADLADKCADELLPSAPMALSMLLRRPRGVVAAITPWNFPTHVALTRVAPALAAGNSVVLKPSELAPLACLRLADLAAEAGVPPGVFNALPGRGLNAGRALALHHDVDALSFVGSSATGQALMQYAGQSNLKVLMLECGGKSPQIVFDDLGDIDSLADALVQGFTWNSGQVCAAGSRILVHDALADRLLPLLQARVRAFACGDPLDPATVHGPLAHAQQHARVRAMLERAGTGDHLVARGQAVAGGPFAMSAHLYESRDPGSLLAQEEIFGPVASVIRFADEAQALALANGTRYGLSATLWTKDLARTHRLVRRLRAGFVVASTAAKPQAADSRHMSGEPAGLSGFGVDGGRQGLLSYTRLQGVTLHMA